jgi:hypothetical protein
VPREHGGLVLVAVSCNLLTPLLSCRAAHERDRRVCVQPCCVKHHSLFPAPRASTLRPAFAPATIAAPARFVALAPGVNAGASTVAERAQFGTGQDDRMTAPSIDQVRDAGLEPAPCRRGEGAERELLEDERVQFVTSFLRVADCAARSEGGL